MVNFVPKNINQCREAASNVASKQRLATKRLQDDDAENLELMETKLRIQSACRATRLKGLVEAGAPSLADGIDFNCWSHISSDFRNLFMELSSWSACQTAHDMQLLDGNSHNSNHVKSKIRFCVE